VHQLVQDLEIVLEIHIVFNDQSRTFLWRDAFVWVVERAERPY